MDISRLAPLVAGVGHGVNVVGAWLLTYAVHSTVLLLAAWGIVAMGRRRWSPAAQHAIWRVAMLAGFVTATAQVASPRPSLGGALRLTEAAKASVAAVQLVQRSTDRGWFAPPRPNVAIPARFALPGGGPVPRATLLDGELASVRMMVFTISRATVAVLVWGLVALALLVSYALARRRLHAQLAARSPGDDTLAAGALRHLASIGGVSGAVALSTSDALPAPAAISSREIVLPTRALAELTLAEQEAVLAHELAHVVRRDTRWLRVAMWLERLAWFQPLNRVARRQMQLAAEFAADAWAVQVTRQPITLARALARVAGWVTGDRRATAALAPGADGSPLVERVRRLTAPPTAGHGLGARAAHAATVAVALSALALLPRVDLAPSPTPGTRRDERFELHLAGGPPGRVAPTGALEHTSSAAPLHDVVRRLSLPAALEASWTGRPPAGTTTTRIRLVRLGGETFRLGPPPGEAGSRLGDGGASLPRRVIVVARTAS